MKTFFSFTRSFRLAMLLLIVVCQLASVNSFAQTASFTYSFVGNDSCAPATIHFNNTSTGASSFLWDFGNSNTSGLTSPDESYSFAGTYTVTLTANPSGVQATKVITIHAPPTAGFTVSSVSVCTGVRVTFTDTSHAVDGGFYIRVLDFGDGTVDTLTGSTTIVQHSFASAGTYFANILVANTAGCYTASGNVQINVINGPVANFSMDPVSACYTNTPVNFTNTTTNQSGTTYTWNFGDPVSGANNTSTLVAPSHLFAANGTYAVTLTATNGVCTTTKVDTFKISPISSVIHSADTVCANTSVNFTNTTNPTPTSYNWTFGDGGTSGASSPSHTYLTAGTYTVTLVATVSSSCAKTVTKTIFVRATPTLSFTCNDSTWCKAPATVNFTASSSAIGATWNWNFGDPFSAGNTSALQNPSHTFTNYGNYSITLTVTDNHGCSATLLKNVYIKIAAPVADFIPIQPDSGCVGSSFTFTSTSTSTVDPISTYNWNFGDGGTGTGATVTHVFNTIGIFDIRLIVTTAQGCKDTMIHLKQIRIGGHPNAAFSFTPSVLCFGDTVHFTDHSTPANSITGWFWDFGDGGTSTQQNPTYVYQNDTGKFSVKLIVYWNGCPDTLDSVLIITVHPPKPDFVTYYNCANPYSVTFVNHSEAADSIWWYWGDTKSDSTQRDSLTHVYTTTGSYNVTLWAYNVQYNCRYLKTITVNIADPIARMVIADTLQCYPATFSFNGQTSQDAGSYLWTFGDPASGALNTSNSQIPDHYYTSPGNYSVKLVITDTHGCKDSLTRVIHNYGPLASFTMGNPISGCAPLPVNFTSTSTPFPGTGNNIVSYTWTYNYGLAPPDIQTVTIPTVSHQFTQSGNYNILLYVTDAFGCHDTALYQSAVHVTHPNPVLADTTVCLGEPHLFTADAGVQTGNSYTMIWNFGDGTPIQTITNSPSVTHTYTDTVTRTIILTVRDSNNCVTTITSTVHVSNPVASYLLTNVTELCSYTFLTIKAGTGDITFWDFTVTGPYGVTKYQGSSKDTFPVSLNFPGTWSLRLIVTNQFGCSDTISGPVAVVEGPSGYFFFSPDSGCSPLHVTFHVHPDPAHTSSELITFGDGTSQSLAPTDSIVTHNYVGTTGRTFYPQVLFGNNPSSGGSCQVNAVCLNSSLGLDSVITLYNPNDFYITDEFGVPLLNDSIIEGHADTLYSSPAYNSGFTYSWTALPSGLALTPFSPPSSALYTSAEGDTAVQLVVQDLGGCASYDFVPVYLLPCDQMVIIPNVFTPNGDSLNDNYYIKDLCPILDFKFTIFNRWGSIVYESSDYQFRWDGTDSNGKDCSDGTYYYVMHAKKKDIHGYIHLIRD